MKIERLGFPDEFARTCAAHLADCTIPRQDVLAALVEVMFFASLHEEEARHAEFSIAWLPPVEGCASVIAISPPVEATPKNLAKLAPATRRETTAIAVRTDEAGRLVAWALVEQRTPAKQPFMIRILGSGVLRVDLAGVPRALYARGETYLLGGGTRVISAAQVLTHTFAAWRAAADPATGIARGAATVVRLAARMLEHGHGGMLLVMPADEAMPVGVRVHYGVGLGEDVLMRRQDDDAVELIARLSAIDNAILLDTDLRLRGFGTQVLEGDAPPMQFEHRDPYSDDVHVDDLGTFKGTRHPAGVIFCMRQPHAAAAVIASQDARLSLAVKNGRGGVEVIGSYERAFGWL